jgi:hypothetical protein
MFLSVEILSFSRASWRSLQCLGVYFPVRAVVRSFDDIILNVKMLGITLIPLAVPFLVEYTTGRNPFFVLGGVPEFTQIREGKFRCQGAFMHPIPLPAPSEPLRCPFCWIVGLQCPRSISCVLCTSGICTNCFCFFIKWASSFCVSRWPSWIDLLDVQSSGQNHPVGNCHSFTGFVRRNEGSSVVFSSPFS